MEILILNFFKNCGFWEDKHHYLFAINKNEQQIIHLIDKMPVHRPTDSIASPSNIPHTPPMPIRDNVFTCCQDPKVQIKILILWSIFLTTLFFIVVSLAPGRPALPLLLGISAFIVSLATVILFRAPDENIRGLRYHRPDAGSWLMFFGFISLFVQLFIRLIASKTFQGNLQDFNFGLKCKFLNETETDSCINYAFVNEFNSYGHMFQGMFSLFLSPSVHVLLRVCCTKHCKRCDTESTLGMTDLLPLGTILYPTYNIIKRGVKSNVGYPFVWGSFSNNCSEWAFGFLLGIHLGCLCEAVAVKYNLYNDMKLLDPNMRQETFMSFRHLDGDKTSRQTKFLELYQQILGYVRVIFGTCFFIVSIAAGIMFAITWNSKLVLGTGGPRPGTWEDGVQTVLIVRVFF